MLIELVIPMIPKIISPSQELAGIVKEYWTLESPQEATPQKNVIIPDGCMKLIFHYGAPYRHYLEDDLSELLPNCFLIGQLTRPYVVAPTGATGTFFVCFHPDGFLPFTQLPIKAMENRAIPLDELFGQEGTALGEQILSAASTASRVSIAEQFLLNRLTSEDAKDVLVRHIVDMILTGNGQWSVTELSNHHHIHRRQLVRKFTAAIGLSPKQLSKTIRLQATLKRLLSEDVKTLTELAYSFDYTDQAHFIKDFKEFTGLTPKAFYGDLLKMSLIFEKKD